MSPSMQENDGHWDCGWQEHKTRQLQRLARLPLSQKLEWLEEAQELAATLAGQRPNKSDEKKTDPY